MVTIDQLKISDDGKNLYLNAHINEASYFSDVYIDKVTVLTENQVSEMDPLTFGDDYVFQQEISGNEKEVDIVLSKLDLNANFCARDLMDNMFFVYITAKGTPALTTPCGMDNMTTVGVTFNNAWLYDAAMNYAKELADTCNIPTGFIDFILNYEAMVIGIESGHPLSAIDRFKWLKGHGSVSRPTSGCSHCGR